MTVNRAANAAPSGHLSEEFAAEAPCCCARASRRAARRDQGVSTAEIRYLCTSAPSMPASVAASGPDPRKSASSASDSHRS